MSIRLKRLYIENYKLFAKKEIIFENYLTVFDGPNGYGKTSIFDAIEFLITGRISRIYESQSISGTYAYESNFLAKDQRKDVILKGEFYDSAAQTSLIIGLKLPAVSGKLARSNNPKSIMSTVISCVLPTYDTPTENWNACVVNSDQLLRVRTRFFGLQNINFFTIFHYIRQEDRLAYFKSSETERTKTIESLFGIQNEVKKQEQISAAQTQVKHKLTDLQKSIKKLQADLDKIPSNCKTTFSYLAIANEKPAWDRHDFAFYGSKSRSLYDEVINSLLGIKQLKDHCQEFMVSTKLANFLSIPEALRSPAIAAWKLQCEKEIPTEELQSEKELHMFLTQTKQLIESKDFIKVDWDKLCENSQLSELLPKLRALTEELKHTSNNQNDLQKSLSSLESFRLQLRNEADKISTFKQGICPYCGHNWESNKHIEQHFSETTLLIQSMLTRESATYSKLVQVLDSISHDSILPYIIQTITSLDSNAALQVFSRFKNSNDYTCYARKCHFILTFIGIEPKNIEVSGTLDDVLYGIKPIIEQINLCTKDITPEYYEENEKYDFQRLFQECFTNIHELEALSQDDIDNKMQYITQLYYASFNQAHDELKCMQLQEAKLTNLQMQLRKYHVALKKSISEYREIVIKEIEIPFFLFSSRLLQTYQAGQGIFINLINGENIRFTAPASEHDALYTMSSGQLSAVLLAFSLSLNKIYAGDRFQMVLIDDPIQCMDDINMISFVELLGQEFCDRQIILSTHEDTFSNFIRYKFTKYKLPQQSITLKES